MADVTFTTALLDSHTPVSRLVTLTATGAVRTVYSPSRIIIEGTVEADREREIRRTFAIRVVDELGNLSPTAVGDEFAPGERLRLERGLLLEGTEVYVTLGTFTITSFESAMDGSLSIGGEDAFGSLAQDFGEVVTVGAGMRAGDALRLLWEPVLGDGSGWDLDQAQGPMGASRTFAEEDERLDGAVSLMADQGLEVYADRLGLPVLRPFPDPLTAVTVRTLEQAAGTALATALARRGDWAPVNRQAVVGDSATGTVVRGEAEITDAGHPHHPARIGYRSAPLYRSAQVTTQFQANSVARRLLTERTLWRDAVTWSGVPDPTLEVEDVVRIVEPTTGTDARYRIDRISMPVTRGAMTLSASRILPLFST